MEELPIIQKTYDLIKWYVPILKRLPRDHRFGLGARLISKLYDLLEELIQARYSQPPRYVDDFSLFSDDRTFLAEARLVIEDYLATLRLKIHPIKSQLFATRLDANFVGFRVFPDHIRVRSHNLKRARCRLRKLRQSYRQGLVSFDNVTQSVQSWAAHLKHGDTWHLRQHIFNSLTFESLS